MNLHQTREAWLQAFVDLWEPRCAALNYPLPAVRVSCGFPSRGALSASRRVLGECWDYTASKEGYHEIFVTPLIDDPIQALEVLVHECGHAAVGTADKHGSKFKGYCKAVGLDGKATATFASDELRHFLAKQVEILGDYPHSAFQPPEKEKKEGKGRLLKVVCGGCGYTLRTTKLWLLRGLPTCCCGSVMTGPDFDADGDIIEETLAA